MEPSSEDLIRYRALMGTALVGTVQLPGSYLAVQDTFWAALTGLPEPDWNMALVHREAPTALAEVLGEITEKGCPALLLLAGDGRALCDQLPRHWKAAGEIPIMAVDPAATSQAADPRVRPAGPEDLDAITTLMTEAFGITSDNHRMLIAAMLEAADPATRWWLLEEASGPVSTVLCARVEDVVTLWCMATPPHFARRGYGRALLGTVLERAAADGATLGLLGATPAGEPLYRATGWETVDVWSIYLNGGSMQFA